MNDHGEKMTRLQYGLGYLVGVLLPGSGHWVLCQDWRRGSYWLVCFLGAIWLGTYLNPHFVWLTYDKVFALPITMISLLDLWQITGATHRVAPTNIRGRAWIFLSLFWLLPVVLHQALRVGQVISTFEVQTMEVVMWAYVGVYLVRMAKQRGPVIYLWPFLLASTPFFGGALLTLALLVWILFFDYHLKEMGDQQKA